MLSLEQELGQIPLFTGIDQEQRRKIAQSSLVDVYEEGRVLFNEGAIVGQVMYIVLDGEVEITKRGSDGHPVVLAIMRRHDFFGEMSLFEQTKRSATARVKTKSRVLVVSRNVFERMMASDPAVANKILLVFIRSLFERLRQTNALAAGLHT